MGEEHSEDDDLDRLFRHLDHDRQAADARVQPWQASIKPGDYFRRSTPYGFPIYGQILEENESREPRLQYFRLCEAYSVACPEGEMGDIHISVIDRLYGLRWYRAGRFTLAGW